MAAVPGHQAELPARLGGPLLQVKRAGPALLGPDHRRPPAVGGALGFPDYLGHRGHRHRAEHYRLHRQPGRARLPARRSGCAQHDGLATAAATPECWQAAMASYPLCHRYPAHGYTCVGGSCASMDPRGNPPGCAAKAPAGFTVDLATGTCDLTWAPQLEIGTRPPLLPPLYLVAIVAMMLAALYFKGGSQDAPAARSDQDVTVLRCRHLPSSPFQRR